MKSDCNIVLDLLPLYIDGAVSNESCDLVEEHLEACPTCAAICEDMRSSMSASQIVQEEAADMDQAAHTLRKKRRRRVWRNVLIGLAVGVVLALVGLRIWTWLTERSTPMSLDQYRVTLSLRADGESVVASVKALGDPMVGYTAFGDDRDGKTVLYLHGYHPMVVSRPAEEKEKHALCNHELCLENGLIDGCYEEVRKGTPEEYVTIWKAGEDITPASAMMERYYEIDDELYSAIVTDETGYVLMEYWSRNWYKSVATDTDAVVVSRKVMTEEEWNDLYNEQMKIKLAVPEWQ